MGIFIHKIRHGKESAGFDTIEGPAMIINGKGTERHVEALSKLDFVVDAYLEPSKVYIVLKLNTPDMERTHPIVLETFRRINEELKPNIPERKRASVFDKF